MTTGRINQVTTVGRASAPLRAVQPEAAGGAVDPRPSGRGVITGGESRVYRQAIDEGPPYCGGAPARTGVRAGPRALLSRLRREGPPGAVQRFGRPRPIR